MGDRAGTGGRSGFGVGTLAASSGRPPCGRRASSGSPSSTGTVEVFGTDVGRVRPRTGGGFSVESDRGLLRAGHAVWAAGEFQYPRDAALPGGPLCRHHATTPPRHHAAIDGWDDLPGGPVTIVGGGESGIDAAVCLSDRGRRVTVRDQGQPWQADDPDPSLTPSTYTMGRLLTAVDDGRIELVGDARVSSVDRGHDHVSCLVYRFRQRFPVVAAEIARRLGHDPVAAIEAYRRAGMYLDDPTCCGNECAC